MSKVFLPRYPNQKFAVQPIPAEFFDGRNVGLGVQVLTGAESDDFSVRHILKSAGAVYAGSVELAEGRLYGFSMPQNPEVVMEKLGWRRDEVRREINQVDLNSGAEARMRFDRFLRPDEMSLFAPEMLGENLQGVTVRKTAFGRSFTMRGDTHSEWEQHPDGERKNAGERASLFLQARTSKDWDYIARTLVGQVNRGHVHRFSNRDLEAMLDIAADGSEKISLMAFRERIEGQITIVRSNGHLSGRDVASALSTAFPAHDERGGRKLAFAQFSTPPAVGEVAAHFLGIREGSTVLEPTVGNGLLAAASAAAGAKVIGFEIDTHRADRARATLKGAEITTGDALDASLYAKTRVDAVLANPPYMELSPPVRVPMAPFPDGSAFPSKKAENAILAHSINALKGGGNAVFVMPGEMIDHSTISGDKVHVQNLLAASFREVDTIALDPRLYQSMGSNFPVLVHFCRERSDDGEGRSPADAARYCAAKFAPDIEGHEPQAKLSYKIPTASSYDEFYQFYDQQVAGLAPTLDNEASIDAPAPTVQEPEPTPERDEQPAPSAGGERHTPTGDREEIRTTAEDRPPAPSEPEAETAEPTASEAEQSSDAEASLPSWDDLDTSNWARPNWFVDDLTTDEFTVAYNPLSQNARGARTVIERTMAMGTNAALRNVAASIEEGTIDEFVAGKLGLPTDRILAEDGPLSPEQVDSMGLSLFRRSEARATIIGDQMGVGKGRQLAAHALNALKVEDRPVLFMTNRENLFTDFALRDMADVSGSSFDAMIGGKSRENGMIRPIIMNGNSSLRHDDEVVFRTSAEELKTAKKNKSLDGYNLVMMTYSQVQVADGAWRAEAIKDWITKCAEAGKPPVLLLDEVHKAAGPESRTGYVMRDIIDHAVTHGAGDIVFSSATSLKSGKNLPLYTPALPDTGLTRDELMLTIDQMPLAVQEILATEMSRTGSLIERKMSEAGVERELIKVADLDSVKMREAARMADDVAPILQEMQAMVPEIKRAATAQFRAMAGGSAAAGSADKLQVDITSPATQLDAFSRYLVGAVKGLYTEELMVNAIELNEKATVVCEFTGDSVAQWLVQKEGGAIALDEDENILSGDREIPVGAHPHIGHVLERFAERMLEIKGTNAFGEETSFRIQGFDGWLEQTRDMIASARLEGLRINVFDKVRDVGEALGQTVEDISGRKVEFFERDGEVFARRRSIPNSIEAASRFNRGKTDVLCFNSSAATGISLQNSPRNGADLRRRCMIKMAFQREITDERQVEGRINRTGQLTAPRYLIPVTGFAADDRIANLFNRANRNLTSSTSATRDNRTNAKHTVDILNPVGEMAVKSVLERNPDVAQRLGIDPEQGSDLARKLLGRSVMLTLAEQNAILGDVDTAFHLYDEKLTAEGRNPLKLGRYDWGAEVTAEKVLVDGNPHSASVAALPLTLNKVTFKEPVAFRPLESIEKQVREGVQKDAADGGGRSLEEVYGYKKAFDRGSPDFKSPLFDDIMGRSTDDFRKIWPVEIPVEIGEDMFFKMEHNLRSIRNKKRGADYSAPFTVEEIKEASESVATRLLNDEISDTGKFLTETKGPGAKPAFKDFNLPLALRAMHRQVTKAHDLSKISDYIVPGAIVAIDRRAVATRIAGAFGSAFEETASDGGLIPAIITNVRLPNNAPFAESKFSISLVVPGSPGTEAVTISSMRTALEAAEVTRATPIGAFSAFENQVIGTNTALQSHQEHRMTPEMKAMHKLFGDKLGAVANGFREIAMAIRDDPRKTGPLNMVGDNLQIDPTSSQIMRTLFDGLPKTAVSRTRYTLEGNMFAGMSAIAQRTGNALGEKVIYSDAEGVWRNAILLNNKGTKEIIASVEAKTSQRATPLPAGIKKAEDIGAYFAGACAAFEADFSGEQFFREGVKDRTAEVMRIAADAPSLEAASFKDIAHAVRQFGKNVDRTFPVSIAVGGDPWSFQAEQYRKQAEKRGRHGKIPDPGTTSISYGRDEPGKRPDTDYKPYVRHDESSIRQILSNITSDQLLVLHTHDGNAAVIFKKTHPLLKDKDFPLAETMRDDSSSRLTFDGTPMDLGKSVLALPIRLQLEEGRNKLGQIVEAAAKFHQGEILACGATRDVNAAIKSASDAVEAKVTAERTSEAVEASSRSFAALDQDVTADLARHAQSDKAKVESTPEPKVERPKVAAASVSRSGPSGP